MRLSYTMKQGLSTYQAIYSHQTQSYPIVINNDGKQLSFQLNEYYFYGTELSAMQTDDELYGQFALHHGSLCDCQFYYDITQILVAHDQTQYKLILHIEHRLGKPADHGGLDDETIFIHFDFENRSYTAQGGFYEDVFLDLIRQLGDRFYFKNCLFCQYSDYAIWGQSAFASLMCFYMQKETYFKVQEKYDYIPFYEKADYVQETALCDLFLANKKVQFKT